MATETLEEKKIRLKKELEELESVEKMARQARKEEYERSRNLIVEQLVGTAKKLSQQLATFKGKALANMNEFHEFAKEYGEVRSNSKGGFGIRNEAGTKRVVLRRNVVNEYDERADMAINLIKDFLKDTVKKRSQADFNTISVLLEKNKQGDLRPDRVAALLRIRDNYNDKRWHQALDLLVEAYKPREVSYNVEFYEVDSQGKEQAVILTFASLSVEPIDSDTDGLG